MYACMYACTCATSSYLHMCVARHALRRLSEHVQAACVCLAHQLASALFIANHLLQADCVYICMYVCTCVKAPYLHMCVARHALRRLSEHVQAACVCFAHQLASALFIANHVLLVDCVYVCMYVCMHVIPAYVRCKACFEAPI